MDANKKLPSELRAQLSKPMPSGAIEAPNAQGLTPIKAAYIIERLNDVFGICGWELVHEKVGVYPNTKSKKNYETNKYEKYTIDHAVVEGYINIPEYNTRTMKYYGGGDIDGVGRTPADGFKSAVTDCLSKCASTLEIGIQVFKGQPWDRTSNETEVAIDFKVVNDPINIKPEAIKKEDVAMPYVFSDKELKDLKLDELKLVLGDVGGNVDVIEKPTKAKIINAIKLIQEEMVRVKEKDIKVTPVVNDVENNTEEIDKKYVEDKLKITKMNSVTIPEIGEGGKRKKEQAFVVWQHFNSMGMTNSVVEEVIKKLNLNYNDKEDLCLKGSKENIIKVLEHA